MIRRFLTGLVVFCLPFVTMAAEFRVDNNVQGVKSTVFLLPDRFYSMIGSNGEIVEFDVEKKMFTLIDPALRIQTQVNAEETRQRVEQLRQQLLSDPNADADSFHYFAFQPKFKCEFEPVTGMLALQSHWIDYEIKTIPFMEASADMYYDFCDWVCYLNFRRNPHSSPMLTRLEVNRFLRQGRRFAVNVSVSIYVKGKQGFAKPDQASSSHEIVRRLGEADHKRIEQAQEFKRTYPLVPFDEYQKRFADKWVLNEHTSVGR